MPQELSLGFLRLIDSPPRVMYTVPGNNKATNGLHMCYNLVTIRPAILSQNMQK